MVNLTDPPDMTLAVDWGVRHETKSKNQISMTLREHLFERGFYKNRYGVRCTDGFDNAYIIHTAR